MCDQLQQSFSFGEQLPIVDNICLLDTVIKEEGDGSKAYHLNNIGLHNLSSLLFFGGSFEFGVQCLLVLIAKPGIINQTLEPLHHIGIAHVLQVEQVHLDHLLQFMTVYRSSYLVVVLREAYCNSLYFYGVI